MSRRILGLDIGSNSIGWAIIDEEAQNIIDLGVRIFPEGVDNFESSKEKSRNEDRRIARGMRRQIARRARRRHGLREVLIAVGLFPANSVEQHALYQHNPYELRAKALDEELTPHELGRVFLHLNQRRGFLSNRKKDRGDKEVKGMLAEISDLEQAIQDSGAKTLGQYLFLKSESFDHSKRVENDHVRNRHTRRDMLEEEFQKIWEVQSKHHPHLLTEKLQYGTLGKSQYPHKPRRKPSDTTDLEAFGIHGIIFFQRKMYWPKSVVGLCELEPKEKRCPRADRHAQQFRLLQEINNLRYIDPASKDECSLDEQQHALLLDHLSTREKATFDQIRKKIGMLDSVKFNLERGKRPNLKGMTVDWMMAKAVGEDWHKRPENEKDAIVRLLLDNEREDDVITDCLTTDFGFEPDRVEAALKVDFPPRYASLSLKAIDNLLPHLERGLVYQSVSDPEQSALHAAGYLRRDELQRRLFDQLPDPARVSLRDCRIGDIPNPVVKRALVELRKVVNAIIREHGKPDEVHVEMARSLRMGPKARKEHNKRTREREAARTNAANEIRNYRQKYPESGVRVNRDSILRFLLWEEQQRECVYCQQSISQHQLFGGDVDIDHILPYSRCLDDSQTNKVVAHQQCNHDKGQRTPYEWLADRDPGRQARVCQHTASLMHKGLMPYGKYRRFLQKELDLDHFIARQLTDTSYIASATAEYLRCLFERDHHVLGLKGQHTAELRRQWGLNTVLSEIADSPAWQEQADLRPGEKNRADHRHHAIDAIVAALTGRSCLQQLSKSTQEISWTDSESRETKHWRKYSGGRIEAPWENFRRDVEEAVSNINVSHRAARKVAGALHDAMPFGPTGKEGVFVKRKLIADLSSSEIEKVRDQGIKCIIVNHLQSQGLTTGRGKNIDKKKLKQALSTLTMPSGVPIKKVRLLVPEKTVQPIRDVKAHQHDDTCVAYVRPGSNHHACLFEWEEKEKPKRDAEYVSRLEACRRLRNRQPLVRRQHSREPDAKFLMSLCPGDMVLAEINGQDRLMVVSTLVSTQKRIHLVDARDARRASEKTDIGLAPNSLIEKYNARKVTVDPLGRIRWAND